MNNKTFLIDRSSSELVLKGNPEMEKPEPDEVWKNTQREVLYGRAMDAYNKHLASLPVLSVSPELAEIWKDKKHGEEVREGVDFASEAGVAYLIKCPITGRPFFMTLPHPELGEVPTYGGPFDSYTIPVKDEDDEDETYIYHRYDHDEGAWVEDESILIPLTQTSEPVQTGEGGMEALKQWVERQLFTIEAQQDYYRNKSPRITSRHSAYTEVLNRIINIQKQKEA